ncbi:MAG: hypothetical protein ACK559_04675, partial [bacterium]
EASMPSVIQYLYFFVNAGSKGLGKWSWKRPGSAPCFCTICVLKIMCFAGSKSIGKTVLIHWFLGRRSGQCPPSYPSVINYFVPQVARAWVRPP